MPRTKTKGKGKVARRARNTSKGAKSKRHEEREALGEEIADALFGVGNLDTDTLDFTQDVKIDPDALDVEFVRLPELAAKYGKALSDAEANVRGIEQELKVTRSTLILQANEDPSVMGSDVKPTAPNIEAYYRTHPDHQALKARLLKAQYKADMLKTAVFAIHKKHEEMQHLVALALADYFTTPSVPHNLRALLTDVEEQRKTGTRGKVKKSLRQQRRGG